MEVGAIADLSSVVFWFVIGDLSTMFSFSFLSFLLHACQREQKEKRSDRYFFNITLVSSINHTHTFERRQITTTPYKYIIV